MDKSNCSLNLIHTFAAKDRIPFVEADVAELPDESSILAVPLSAYMPTPEDEIHTTREVKVILQRILITWLPFFKELEDEVEWHIKHPFSDQSSLKSEMVSYQAHFEIITQSVTK